MRNYTGTPWPRGYIDLERGRPALHIVSTFNTVRITDIDGSAVNLGNLNFRAEQHTALLRAILLTLSHMAGTNIKEEDII